MGVDPSLTGTAAVLMAADLSYEVFRFGSKPAADLLGRFQRYKGMVKQVHDLVSRFEVQHVFLEGYSYSSKGKAILDIAEYGSELRRMLLHHHASGHITLPVEIPPTSLKKFATGGGRADKMQMCVAIATRWGVQFKSDDEFDAYALARLGLCYVGWATPENQAQRDVLKVLQNG